MQSKKVLLIHGPVSGNAYSSIFDSISKNTLMFQEIIISTYLSDKEKTEGLLRSLGYLEKVKLIYSKDLINPGFYNINRQIITVRAGLNVISDDAFVVKLRNDQWFSQKKLARVLDSLYFNNQENSKILTTNCYTREDRYYHPSDMFLCGRKSDLFLYYGLDLRTKTHVDQQLEMVFQLKYSALPLSQIISCPETELFKAYLKSKQWECLNTKEDSFNAIKTYMNVVNTWTIKLRWNKQRNAFLPKGTIILPQSFTMAPFEGAPQEIVKCYSCGDFTGKFKIKDRYFIFFSRCVFSLKYNKGRRILEKFKGMLPPFIKNILKRTPVGKIIVDIFN